MPGPRILGPRRARTLAAVAFGLVSLVRTTTADPPAAEPGAADPVAPGAQAPPAEADVEPPPPNWILSHQAPDGRWPAATFDRVVRGRPAAFEDVASHGLARNDVLATAFALSVLAAAGHAPTSPGPMGEAVAAGAHALRSMQRTDGSFADPRATLGATNHAITVETLAELAVAWGDARDLVALERAVAFYVASREAGVASWRDELGPSAVTPIGWIAAARAVAVDAARAAWVSWRLLGDDPAAVVAARERRPRLDLDSGLARDDADVRTWLHASSGTWTPGRTGLALWLHAVGSSGPDWKDAPAVRAAAAWLEAHPPRWEPSGEGVDAAGWFLATRAAHRHGGALWTAWSRAIQAAVVETQRRDGTTCTYRGSWDPIGEFADEGGRVFSTAMMARTLTVWYAYDKVFGDDAPVLRGAAREPPRVPPPADAPRPPRLPPCD